MQRSIASSVVKLLVSRLQDSAKANTNWGHCRQPLRQPLQQTLLTLKVKCKSGWLPRCQLETGTALQLEQ